MFKKMNLLLLLCAVTQLKAEYQSVAVAPQKEVFWTHDNQVFGYATKENKPDGSYNTVLQICGKHKPSPELVFGATQLLIQDIDPERAMESLKGQYRELGNEMTAQLTDLIDEELSTSEEEAGCWCCEPRIVELLGKVMKIFMDLAKKRAFTFTILQEVLPTAVRDEIDNALIAYTKAAIMEAEQLAGMDTETEQFRAQEQEEKARVRMTNFVQNYINGLINTAIGVLNKNTASIKDAISTFFVFGRRVKRKVHEAAVRAEENGANGHELMDTINFMIDEAFGLLENGKPHVQEIMNLFVQLVKQFQEQHPEMYRPEFFATVGGALHVFDAGYQFVYDGAMKHINDRYHINQADVESMIPQSSAKVYPLH